MSPKNHSSSKPSTSKPSSSKPSSSKPSSSKPIPSSSSSSSSASSSRTAFSPKPSKAPSKLSRTKFVPAPACVSERPTPLGPRFHAVGSYTPEPPPMPSPEEPGHDDLIPDHPGFVPPHLLAKRARGPEKMARSYEKKKPPSWW